MDDGRRGRRESLETNTEPPRGDKHILKGQARCDSLNYHVPRTQRFDPRIERSMKSTVKKNVVGTGFSRTETNKTQPRRFFKKAPPVNPASRQAVWTILTDCEGVHRNLSEAKTIFRVIHGHSRTCGSQWKASDRGQLVNRVAYQQPGGGPKRRTPSVAGLPVGAWVCENPLSLMGRPPWFRTRQTDPHIMIMPARRGSEGTVGNVQSSRAFDLDHNPSGQGRSTPPELRRQ